MWTGGRQWGGGGVGGIASLWSGGSGVEKTCTKKNGWGDKINNAKAEVMEGRQGVE